MQRYLIPLLVLSWFLSSCGTYRYYQPTTNAVLFKNQGEVHIAGDIGSSGVSVKGGAAISDKIAVVGIYNNGISTYEVSEGEVGMGYYSSSGSTGFFLGGGLGFGSNYEFTDSTKTEKKYEGSFNRPFIQLNYGITGGKVIGKLQADLITSIKSNYFIYKGAHLDGSGDQIESNYFFIEPAVLLALGSRSFKFDIIAGFPITPKIDPLNKRTNARTLPANIGIGLRVILGRD